MTRTAGFMRAILAVQPLGRIRTSRPVPATRLARITHTGPRYPAGACESPLRRPGSEGEPPMVGIIAITAVGIFIIGVVVGIVLVASYGIRREEKQGLFFADEPSDGVNRAARRLNGLYIV